VQAAWLPLHPGKLTATAFDCSPGLTI